MISMKLKKEELKKFEKNLSKRIFHIKYNYMKLEEIKKELEEFEKSKKEYEIKLKYDDEILKNSNLYQFNDLYILEIENHYILIRKDEKSFFFNNFILEINEYNKKNEKKKSLIDYMKNISNFIILEEEKIIILDIKENYLIKK